jgi:hypothetical protein
LKGLIEVTLDGLFRLFILPLKHWIFYRLRFWLNFLFFYILKAN